MSLDVGNKFNVFSPTHDSKLVTRLQHVTHAVRAASRAADNNRMWHISGASSAAQWWMSLLVCLPSASRTGTCRLISMGSWPWRRQKIWIRAVASAEIEGEIANEHVSAPRAVNKMQWSLMRSFMVTFSSDSDEILDVVGAIREKTDVAGERGKMLKQEDCNPHNGYSSESEAASRGTSCSGLLKEDQLCSHWLKRLVLQWEKLQAKRRVERLLVELNSTVKKTGFN